MHFGMIGCDDYVLPELYPLPQIINVQSSELNTIRDLFTGKAWVKVLQSVSDINESWSCPVCSQPKWADMVGCDVMIGITGYACQTYQRFRLMS